MTDTWVHVLAGSDAIASAAPRVEAELLRLLGQVRGRVQLDVSPTCGWISMSARDQLLGTRRPALPSAADARKRAERFLRDLATRLRPSPDLPLIFMPPLPGDPLELVSVPHPHYPEWNHWLYRTQPRLPTRSGGSPIPVFGSALEVRIGDGGRVIGFHSRWRPTTGARVSCVATEEPETERDRKKPQQIYLLEGAAIPQAYLAPYYLVDEGHDFHLVSGGSLALVVEFELEDSENKTTVRAVTAGGSGNYHYSWARLSVGAVVCPRSVRRSHRARRRRIGLR